MPRVAVGLVVACTLVACTATAAHATAQYPQELVRNGRVLSLQATLLAPLVERRHDLDDLFEAESSARWRGYIGTWHIEGGPPVAWSPDGATIPCCGPVAPAAIVLLDAATGTDRHRFDRPASTVTCLSFSRDGRHLVAGHMDGTAIVWDLQRAPAAPR